jgi:hypothetical protein
LQQSTAVKTKSIFHNFKFFSMFRLLVILSVATALIVSGTSCSSTMRTAEGHRNKPFSKFNFRFNNNQVSSASVYKRYVAYNKRQQAKGRSTNPQVLAKKSAEPKSTIAKKGLLAVQ